VLAQHVQRDTFEIHPADSRVQIRSTTALHKNERKVILTYEHFWLF